MGCICCSAKTPYFFCKRCSPKFGENVKINGYSYYIGQISLWKAILDRIMGRTVIRWWVGTDYLLLFFRPPGYSRFKIFRIRTMNLLVSMLINQHFFISKNLFTLPNSRIEHWL